MPAFAHDGVIMAKGQVPLACMPCLQYKHVLPQNENQPQIWENDLMFDTVCVFHSRHRIVVASIDLCWWMG